MRENQGLTYGIGSSFRPAFDGRTWSISGEMNSANAEKALEETIKIMENSPLFNAGVGAVLTNDENEESQSQTDQQQGEESSC